MPTYLKCFKTRESMNRWIEKNRNRITYTEVFINNGYALEWKFLRKIL